MKGFREAPAPIEQRMDTKPGFENILGKELENIKPQDMPHLPRDFNERLNRQLYALCENKSDDNGKPYLKDGKLIPDNTYVLNGAEYKTDGNGNILAAKAIIDKTTPDNERNESAQRKAGGEDRKPTDQGGHIIARIFGGDGNLGNLIPMDRFLNRNGGDFFNMEKEIRKAIEKEGKTVDFEAQLIYENGTSRPDKIVVTTIIDGEKTVYTFDNNMDGSLMEKVPEAGCNEIMANMEDTGGQVSSVKEVYDREGNLVSTDVTVTYTDDTGKPYRSITTIEGGHS